MRGSPQSIQVGSRVGTSELLLLLPMGPPTCGSPWFGAETMAPVGNCGYLISRLAAGGALFWGVCRHARWAPCFFVADGMGSGRHTSSQDDFSERAKIFMAISLTQVTFKLSVKNKLPKVAYSTSFDQYAISCQAHKRLMAKPSSRFWLKTTGLVDPGI